MPSWQKQWAGWGQDYLLFWISEGLTFANKITLAVTSNKIEALYSGEFDNPVSSYSAETSAETEKSVANAEAWDSKLRNPVMKQLR